MGFWGDEAPWAPIRGIGTGLIMESRILDEPHRYGKERAVRCTELLSALRRTTIVTLLTGAAIMALSGCNSLLDQSEVTRGPKSDRLVVPILNSIDPIDEAQTEFATATEVRPQDLKVFATDYVIGRNDLVTISIFDLITQGVESVRTARVSETGLLTLPLLNEPIQASGLTEIDLQKAIATRYEAAGLIKNAQVSVTVTERRQQTFNITGAVARPGQYPMVEADFRLIHALLTAGEVTYPADYLYVIRKLKSDQPATRPAAAQPGDASPATGPADLAPRSEANGSPLKAMADQPQAAATPPANAPGNDERYMIVDGKPVLIGAPQPAGQETGNAPATAPAAIPGPQPTYEFGADLLPDEAERVIRVPLQQLRNGDLRYNIVVRPEDTIVIPVPTTGFYYMGGHVGAPGAYSLTGPKVTLVQAVVAARGLDPLAVPKRTDIIRRVDGEKAVFVRVNLEQIAKGQQPDIFLKPNDTVQVGTDWYPPFLAAIRGAFRFTYGFGFLYDRNFAPVQEGLERNND